MDIVNEKPVTLLCNRKSMFAPLITSHGCIYFDEPAYALLKEHLATARYSSIFILVDEHTERFCLPAFLEQLRDGYTAEILSIPAGEIHKNIATCTYIWEALARNRADRSSLLIALGGGVVTDLGGFVAATYMRGIQFINIPTSLLAMADASVGGKTGVDLGSLKNMIGAFHFPQMTLIDSSFLATLPQNHLKSGWAELLKHGLIYNEQYWNELSAYNAVPLNYLTPLIYKSVQIKNEIVEQDPQEKGLRKILNYGHTLGHAIESHFLYSPQPLLHGEAVAAGMLLAAYLSHKMVHLPIEKLTQVKNVICSFFQKIPFTTKDCTAIISLLRHDKKNHSGKIFFILLEDIGKPIVNQQVTDDLIHEAFDYYNT